MSKHLSISNSLGPITNTPSKVLPSKVLHVRKVEQSDKYKNAQKITLDHDLLDKLDNLNLQSGLKKINKLSSPRTLKLNFVDNINFNKNVISILKDDEFKIKSLFKTFKEYNDDFVSLIRDDLLTISKLLVILKTYNDASFKLDLNNLKSIYVYVLLGNQTYHNILLAKDILVNKHKYLKYKSKNISKSKSKLFTNISREPTSLRAFGVRDKTKDKKTKDKKTKDKKTKRNNKKNIRRNKRYKKSVKRLKLQNKKIKGGVVH